MNSKRSKPMNRQQEREQKILLAATELFSEQGYHHSSTRQIAKAAGVSEGTVFNYFDSKNALLEEIVRGFYSRLTETAQDGLHEKHDGFAQFTFLAENHIRLIAADNFLLMRLLAVYFSEHFNFYLDYQNSSIFKHSKTYTRLFDRIIREGIARNELRNNIKLSAMRDLFFGSLEYGVRSLLAQLEPGEKQLSDRKLKQYAKTLCHPIWESMKVRENAEDSRELALCERLERVAERLESNLKA
ncbi:TetR/AcrR family transcriptional regulator [Pseudoteredinibacter isoporae]|uniref:TetR/AcrR family transcriptional regulator n=1 Tax=Pseudoteredinibacter isoporae TaxID=570281 RepID=UPI00310C651A